MPSLSAGLFAFLSFLGRALRSRAEHTMGVLNVSGVKGVAIWEKLDGHTPRICCSASVLEGTR